VSELVTPDAETFGIRVTGYTPLGQIVGRLRRMYPDASYGDLTAMAERMRRAKPADVEVPPPAVAEAAPKRSRRPKTEAAASLVPVEGGEPIPAEPPAKW